MNGNEISELTSMLPPPAVRNLPDERADVLREHMLTEFRRASEKNTAVPRRMHRRLARRDDQQQITTATSSARPEGISLRPGFFFGRSPSFLIVKRDRESITGNAAA